MENQLTFQALILTGIKLQPGLKETDFSLSPSGFGFLCFCSSFLSLRFNAVFYPINSKKVNVEKSERCKMPLKHSRIKSSSGLLTHWNLSKKHLTFLIECINVVLY